jgi:uncharacterized membrane protein
MAEESETDDDLSLESLVTTAVVSLTMITAFGLLAAGVDWFWVVFIVGFAGVLPAASVLANWYESRSASESSTEQPIEALRTRYANGEISEAEFERRVETLIETEPGSETAQREPSSGPDTDLGTLSGPEPEAESLSGLETEIDSPADTGSESPADTASESPADTDPESLADIEAESESLSDVDPESKSESLSEIRSEMDPEVTDPERELEEE